jgi:hypothetical protein
MPTKVQVENLKEKDHLEYLSTEGSKILERILEK